MFFRKHKKALEDSRREKLEAAEGNKQADKMLVRAIKRLDSSMETLANSTIHGIVDTVDYVRGKP